MIHYVSPSVDLPSQNLAQNRQYHDHLTFLPAHTEQRFVEVAKVLIICTTSGSSVILLPPTHQQGSRNNQGHQMNQRCTIMTKLVLRSEPHACAQTAVRQSDDRQMRMTERDTPRAPKIMLTSIRPRQGTGNTPIKDRYQWPHRP